MNKSIKFNEYELGSKSNEEYQCNKLDEKEDKCYDGINIKTTANVRKVEKIKQYEHGIKREINEEYNIYDETDMNDGFVNKDKCKSKKCF